MASEPTTLPPNQAAPGAMDQRMPGIRSMFEQITPSYDRLNFLFSGAIDRYWRRVAAQELTRDLRPCRRVLDIATGTGDLARAVAKRAGEAKIIGVDFTRPMLERAKEKYPSEIHHWTEADGLNLPIRDAAFDGCCIAFGLRNMEDKPAALREMHRVLRPGGRVAILEFSTPKNPLFARLYDFYSFRVMPRVGKWVSGSDAYRYLTESIRENWDVPKTAEELRTAGFTNVRHRSLTGGIACVHLGEKPEAESK